MLSGGRLSVVFTLRWPPLSSTLCLGRLAAWVSGGTGVVRASGSRGRGPLASLWHPETRE
jgi:hypothetical protein